MNNMEQQRLNVLSNATICHICLAEALPGVDEFGGHTCEVCRARLAEGRKRLALQGDRGNAYSERPPRADVR